MPQTMLKSEVCGMTVDVRAWRKGGSVGSASLALSLKAEDPSALPVFDGEEEEPVSQRTTN